MQLHKLLIILTALAVINSGCVDREKTDGTIAEDVEKSDPGKTGEYTNDPMGENTSTSIEDSKKATDTGMDQAVPFQIIGTGECCEFEGNYVITDKEYFNILWGETVSCDVINTAKKTPETDFEKDVVIGIYQRNKPNGYSMQVAQIVSTGERHKIYINVNQPSDAASRNLDTCPYTLIRTGKTEKKIEFIFRSGSTEVKEYPYEAGDISDFYDCRLKGGLIKPRQDGSALPEPWKCLFPDGRTYSTTDECESGCGDGICQNIPKASCMGPCVCLENPGTCPEDCDINGTAGANNCITEGNSIDTSGQQKCCPGLEAISCIHPTGTLCPNVMCDSFPCTACGNGVCGMGENFCNCPRDCKSDEAIESEAICQNMCGDGKCQNSGIISTGGPCPETNANCPQDCVETIPADESEGGYCGDGICQNTPCGICHYETAFTCPEDCGSKGEELLR